MGDLVAGHLAGNVATRKVVLAWSVRTTETLEWVRPWMDEILAMPNRKEILEVLLFITKPRTAREVISRSEMIQMFPEQNINPAQELSIGVLDD